MPESVLPQIGAQRVGGNPEQEERHYDVASGKRGGEIIDLDVRVQPLQNLENADRVHPAKRQKQHHLLHGLQISSRLVQFAFQIGEEAVS